ncbi:MAG: hypothetical protein FJW79_05730 [Actinobacteria bacterium]|nr:hypothetical protein [Actinomycetota bacterium]
MRGRTDSGFSVIEVVVASGLSVILVALLGSVLAAALRGAQISRDYQVAVGLGSEQVEQLRSLSWAELAMSSVDEAAPWLTPDHTTLSGAASGLGHDEVLVVMPAGGAVAPSAVRTMSGLQYTAWRYVSRVSADVRRVTVLVEWQGQSGARSYHTSAVVSELSSGGFGTTTTIPPATSTTTEAATTSQP